MRTAELASSLRANEDRATRKQSSKEVKLSRFKSSETHHVNNGRV
jgi:hypothetical protein